jgi:hypothetical protein
MWIWVAVAVELTLLQRDCSTYISCFFSRAQENDTALTLFGVS